ncbi:hypothetical protein EVAR_46488_1 [Eumeta japonica]|uniref:Uncharacterized protein n=1 Tax=Eumeta variegata TaxID=151549 RepID=A0A4C1WT25_EUMVA|nr:hypothetical protein EVAR_46488_1 [Eumeta japonica]
MSKRKTNKGCRLRAGPPPWLPQRAYGVRGQYTSSIIFILTTLNNDLVLHRHVSAPIPDDRDRVDARPQIRTTNFDIYSKTDNMAIMDNRSQHDSLLAIVPSTRWALAAGGRRAPEVAGVDAARTSRALPLVLPRDVTDFERRCRCAAIKYNGDMQHNARNSAVVTLFTKASQWRKIGTRERKGKGRGALNLRIVSFADDSQGQSFFCILKTAHTPEHATFESETVVSCFSVMQESDLGCQVNGNIDNFDFFPFGKNRNAPTAPARRAPAPRASAVCPHC